MKKLEGKDIALFLNKPLHGDSRSIEKPADLQEGGPKDIVWVKSYAENRLQLLETFRPALAICDADTAQRTSVPHIVSDNPRLDFIRVLNHFFKKDAVRQIHPTALIEDGAVLGTNVSVGAYSRIGKNVRIGDRSVLGAGVDIEGEVLLGQRCVIKANSVLGGQGFGFEYDEAGIPMHFPHIGKIILEDDVWIGACSTVEIGALGTTRIGRGSKVDDLVQIGHNVTIGANTLIMANSVICGGAEVGERCWIAPNSVIKEKVRIGRRVTIGLGSVVLKDIPDGLVVAGVPAKPLKDREDKAKS